MEIKEFKEKKEQEFCEILFDLIDNWEEEIIEFKQADKSFKKDEIGQYFSAISNEANLAGLQHGWLVFGVNNKSRKITGTDYRNTEGLRTLKHEISEDTTGSISFLGVYEVYPVVDGEKKRVIMFQIPAAMTAIPTGWKKIEYAREGESIVPLSEEKRERIRRQEKMDWSKQFVAGATIENLDKGAITIAREKYKDKLDDEILSSEVDRMTDEEFLERRNLLINGRVTNAAMLLLGNAQYEYMFARAPEASWRIYDSKGENIRDYKIFKIPFITLGDRMLENIRNLTYRYMPDQTTLFPVEIKQYDNWVLRELLNNCIAHSDYAIGGRIYLHEFEDKLIFTNPGAFIPGSIEPILKPSYTSPFHRNQLLADAMVMFNMIDTETTGIRKVYYIQRDRFFPMPDYSFEDGKVNVTVYGKEIDQRFTHLLHDNNGMELIVAYLLDRVQKGLSISNEAVKLLRKYKLVEGRVGNLYLAISLAKDKEGKAAYIKNKGFDNKYYQDLIIEYLEKFGRAEKSDLRELLYNKLPETMTENQKDKKVSNLTDSMKKKGIIRSESTNRRRTGIVLTCEYKKVNKSEK